MKIKNIKEYLCNYFSEEKQYFINDKEEIGQKNINNLLFLSWAALVATILCMIFAKIMIYNWLPTIYHLSAVIFFFVFAVILSCSKNKINCSKSNIICILFYIGLIAVSIVICVFPYPNDVQVFVSLIYVIVPSILIMSTKTNLLLVIISEIAFVILSYNFKPENVFRFDMFSTITGLLFSIIVMHIVLSLRILDYKNRTKYKDMSIKDSLCQIYNKRAFETYSKVFIENHKKCYALTIIDVDSFKSVNDTYGHKVGDTVLMYLGKLLEDKISCNAYNGIAGRFGGDEFCSVIEYNGDIEQLKKHLESLQSEFRKNTSKILGQEVSCSIGVALSSVNDMPDYDKLFSIADKALYKSKHTSKGSYNIYYYNK